MRGELLWFNESKDQGRIRTDRGEQLIVYGESFEPGHAPRGRCAGTPVSFERITLSPDRDAHAVEVFVIGEAPQRRARLRGGGGFRH